MGNTPLVKGKRGIALFEVLLALLVLSIGITSCLQAFRHMIQISNYSRDFFEAQFVAADVLFPLFALPADIEWNPTLDKQEQFEHKHITLSRSFYYKSSAEEITPELTTEGEEVTIGGIDIEEPSVVFERLDTTMFVEADTLFTIETFHMVQIEEEEY